MRVSGREWESEERTQRDRDSAPIDPFTLARSVPTIAHRPLPIGPPTLLSAHATTHYMRHVLHAQLSTPQPRTLFPRTVLYVHTYCTCCTVTRWDYWCLFAAYRCLSVFIALHLHHTPAYYTILQHTPSAIIEGVNTNSTPPPPPPTPTVRLSTPPYITVHPTPRRN